MSFFITEKKSSISQVHQRSEVYAPFKTCLGVRKLESSLPITIVRNKKIARHALQYDENQYWWKQFSAQFNFQDKK